MNPKSAWWTMRLSGVHAVGVHAVVLAILVLMALAQHADAFVYWANVSNSDSKKTIGRADLDGTGAGQSFIGGIAPYAVAVDPAHVYWIDGQDSSTSGANTIGRANLDGTGVDRNLVQTSSQTETSGLAVDSNHIFWASAEGDRIGRSNLNGSGVNESFINADDGLGAPYGVAVDAKHVYWTAYYPGGIGPDAWEIGRANLDGTGVDPYFIPTSRATGVAVDANYIYWTTSHTIARATLDGTIVNESFISGVDAGHGVAVDAHHIYWASNDLDSHNTVARASLDGSKVDEGFIQSGPPSTTQTIMVAVDPLSSKVAGKVKANPNQAVKAVLVKLKVAASEPLTAKATGTIRFNPTCMLKPRTVEIAAGRTKILRLKPKKKAQAKKIADALDQGRKVTAKLEVRLTSKAGSSTTEALRIRLKR